jgi:hypothetical protein
LIIPHFLCDDKGLASWYEYRMSVAILPMVSIELFGMARQRAEQAQVSVQAATLADALRQLDAACPQLGVLQADGTLSPHYLLSVNGERFVGSLHEMIPTNAALLLMSADAGG